MQAKWSHLKDCKVVRLNAELMPVNRFEAAMEQHYGITPILVEAETPDAIIPHVADADAIFAISVSLPEAVIDSLQCCKVISRLGNGTDKIAVARAKEHGILVTNVPYFCVPEMADHAMGMILALHRRFLPMQAYLVRGDYRTAREESLQIRRLSTQTLGIVGFGASGQELAKRARACGMRVIATRRRMEKSDEAAALGVELTDFETILTEADYLSLNIPLTPSTYNLIDAAAIQRMKRGACLINTARGAIVDEQALAQALRDGHLAGAAIDTFHDIDIFATNPAPPQHPLLELDNVILTPHVSGLAVEAQAEVAKVGVENVVTVLSGYWPQPDQVVNTGVAPRVPLKPFDSTYLDRVDIGV
jgi:D-3-phosphoglycerate dehydrogenase / 2-oxoglutarate reductase